MENINLEDTIKPRKVWKALLLSLFALGLGQIYNGQIKKCLIIWICIIFISFVFAATKFLTTFYGWITLCVILIGIQLYVHIDACVSAKSQKNYLPKKYNKRYFYVIFGVIIYAVFWLFFASPFLNVVGSVRNFKIPTEANEPTLQIGDNVVADMRAYKKSTPDYADIVIFNIDDAPYIFRVIGKPNDTLSIKDNSLIINNKPVKTLFIRIIETDNFLINEYEEELPNGRKYLIYRQIPNPYPETVNIDNIIVPADSYFLMGDNRDNAFDSRYLGFIKREQIIGKAAFILTGKSFERRNIDLNAE